MTSDPPVHTSVLLAMGARLQPCILLAVDTSRFPCLLVAVTLFFLAMFLS
jgi:hypothetical protein